MKESYAAISGDFSRIFDHRDYLSMINTPDQAACVLRGHLILEEFLHLWVDKATNTEDIFEGVFVPFKTKLVISKNIGLDNNHFKVLDQFNELRNRFGHRKGYGIEESTLDSLALKVDSITEPKKILSCKEMCIFLSGKDEKGSIKNVEYHYSKADSRIRFVIIFVTYMFKLSWWLQSEFNKRGIKYTIISGLPS